MFLVIVFSFCVSLRIHRFVVVLVSKRERENKTVLGVSPEVIELRQAHAWPGNIREFQSLGISRMTLRLKLDMSGLIQERTADGNG